MTSSERGARERERERESDNDERTTDTLFACESNCRSSGLPAAAVERASGRAGEGLCDPHRVSGAAGSGYAGAAGPVAILLVGLNRRLKLG